MKRIIFTILLCFSQNIFAQQIEGKVVQMKDGSEEAIAKANITWEGTNIGTMSDEKGDYIIKSPTSYPVTLIITFVGYKRSDKYATYDNFWKSEEFSLLNLEGQLHKELRGLVAKAFLPRSVQQLVPYMEGKSNELFEKNKGTEFDMLKDYAEPY